MKPLLRNLPVLTLLFTSGHGAADVIYSGLQDISIPTTYAGISVDVDGVSGWDFNPFLGGVYLSNSSAFQPARLDIDSNPLTIGGMDRVLNFTAGSTINSGLKFGVSPRKQTFYT